MPPRILIVEDEQDLAELLRYNLEAEGFQVFHAGTGDEAELMVVDDRPDLVLLDWMLPSVTGLELCRRFRSRSQTRAIPIIMLTARAEEADRVRGLSTGADDYVTKPFSLPELIERIKAILRRVSPERVAAVLTYQDITYDRGAHKAMRGGQALKLGPTEFRLLECFMENRGLVMSRSDLLDHVWGRDAFVDERTVDVHVGRLRKSLTLVGSADPIRTVRGAGYVFGEI